MEENIRQGLNAINNTAESKMSDFSGLFIMGAFAAETLPYHQGRVRQN